MTGHWNWCHAVTLLLQLSEGGGHRGGRIRNRGQRPLNFLAAALWKASVAISPIFMNFLLFFFGFNILDFHPFCFPFIYLFVCTGSWSC